MYCIPRPGKAATKRRIFESEHKCTFHHINAFELDGGDTVVIDTLAREHVDFSQGYLETDVAQYQDPQHMTTMRRIVCKGDAKKAVDWDLRDVPVLNRLVEFPAMLAPEQTGQPHSLIFANVRPAPPSPFASRRGV